MKTNHWRLVWWFLFAVWVTCAVLNMNNLRVGLLTNYGADLTIPAWLYIATRSLHNPEKRTLLNRYIGRSPAIAAIVLFFASTLTEVSQYFAPNGIFSGTFDYYDILAYAIGIGICYYLDKRFTPTCETN